MAGYGVSHESDEAVIKACLKGDTDCFAVLVARYKNALSSFIFSRLRNMADTEDAAQEVFIRAHNSLKELKVKGKFSSWIFSIAHNVCVDLLRAKKSTVSIEKLTSEDDNAEDILPDDRKLSPLDEASRKEMNRLVLKEIGRLPEYYGSTLVLKYINGYSCQEIANLQGISIGTVTSRLSRAHEMLKTELDKYVDWNHGSSEGDE